MIPNHVLMLGPPHTGKLRVSELVIGKNKVQEAVDLNHKSHSGIIVKGDIQTKYYLAKLNILIDEFPSDRTEAQTQTGGSSDEEDNLTHKYDTEEMSKQLRGWFMEFTSSECKELREVLDGFIFTVDLDTTSQEYFLQMVQILNEIKQVFEEEENEEVFMVVVGVSKEIREYVEYEDMVIQNGLEFIYFNEGGENEYKDKIGKDRLIEILETHEWKNMEDCGSKDEDEYKRNRVEKLSEMTERLIKDEGDEEEDKKGEDQKEEGDEEADKKEEMDLTRVMQKLQIAKGEASSMKNHQQRETYVNKVIEELIDYI